MAAYIGDAHLALCLHAKALITTMNSNTRQRTDDTTTRALRIVLQQQDLSSCTDVCDALQQQATPKL